MSGTPRMRWALRDSNPRPQPCESDSGTRTGWFPTARDGLTRDDQDVSSDPKMAKGSSCGAFCGPRIRRRHGGAAWRLICGTLGATPTKTQTLTASGSPCGDGTGSPRRVVVPVAVGRMGHHVLRGRASTSRCSVRVRVAESATERGARASCSARSTALRASRSFLRPAAVTSSR